MQAPEENKWCTRAALGSLLPLLVLWPRSEPPPVWHPAAAHKVQTYNQLSAGATGGPPATVMRRHHPTGQGCQAQLACTICFPQAPAKISYFLLTMAVDFQISKYMLAPSSLRSRYRVPIYRIMTKENNQVGIKNHTECFVSRFFRRGDGLPFFFVVWPVVHAEGYAGQVWRDKG